MLTTYTNLCIYVLESIDHQLLIYKALSLSICSKIFACHWLVKTQQQPIYVSDEG